MGDAMRVLRTILVCCGVAAFGAEAGAAEDVFTVKCGGRVYHFTNGRFHGANDFYAGFTIDLSRMVWARTDDLGDIRKIAEANDHRIILTDRYEDKDAVAEAIMRKTLKYTKRLEFHQFSEDFSAQCRIAALVPLPAQ